MAEQLLSRPEVAEVLNVTAKTLAEWAHRGQGPRYYLLGKHAQAGEEQDRPRYRFVVMGSRARSPAAGIAALLPAPGSTSPVALRASLLQRDPIPY
jgi:hypothetical protein